MTLKEVLFKAEGYEGNKLFYRRKWGSDYMVALRRKTNGGTYNTFLFLFKVHEHTERHHSLKITWSATTEDIVADDWELIDP